MNIWLAIILIVVALILGIFIGILWASGRILKRMPYSGDILLDWNIVDPSNISIQNPKNITKWQNHKYLKFGVIVKNPDRKVK